MGDENTEPSLDALLAKLVADREAFMGLEVGHSTTALAITEEWIGKLLGLPEAQALESAGEGYAATLVGGLVAGVTPGGFGVLTGPIAGKGVALALHALIAWVRHKSATLAPPPAATGG